ncbi:MAG: pilus assembly protein PilC [Zetaproteobacteria bacterium CG_4_9_14_3_um_filter_49_83]|nr:MAG: pilus assembly protein PilC [Zetaproteobacteria bacterium CG1_02_49_23]PIQ30057.1 MAG: pilus assembly protein PilC [Zetaproteobacteria bacterium CG17_big_fil_post_rev_8_21_14_2_50_50_13]PIV29201.1 MAG: pilus assembly protein PilC [Zetaproteobacteria bacterium CG02_land_8_20_14_3_00_50_9]PIY55995.1 MAG: pilus assembly protein PilC [Zetaproteobacteria bacterium CG_4_10_14_0_8_um_filter_49_80]PJA36329.1 MAG: pilus assembly protein PilC [Zetaproteobacteria bacterium CG_4_9_14_3_um_filter_49
MAEFVWTGKTREGQVKKGETKADNKNLVMGQLRKQGLVDISVKNKPKNLELFPEKVDERDISIFFRMLSTMINAGLPLVQAFEMAEKGADKKAMTKLLSDVRGSLEAGTPLGESMRNRPKEFDKLTCSLVEAGEQGGILDTILLRLCEYKEKSLALKSKIKSAMIYPISIMAIAFIVTAILMIFVIPIFGEMFADFGADLPGPTKITMAISDAFVEYWYVVVGAPMGLIYAIKAVYKTPQGHYQLDKMMLNIPVLGDVLRKGAVARFCRTFSTLSAAGVPIMDALDTVAETSGNVVIEQVILSAKDSISQGQTLTEPLEASGIFPIMVTQMISIGEETGALEEMLGKIADFYEQEVDTAVDGMTALMEPLIMAFLGVVIGGLVISMYLPIFKMASVV